MAAAVAASVVQWLLRFRRVMSAFFVLVQSIRLADPTVSAEHRQLSTAFRLTESRAHCLGSCGRLPPLGTALTTVWPAELLATPLGSIEPLRLQFAEVELKSSQPEPTIGDLLRHMQETQPLGDVPADFVTVTVVHDITSGLGISTLDGLAQLKLLNKKPNQRLKLQLLQLKITIKRTAGYAKFYHRLTAKTIRELSQGKGGRFVALASTSADMTWEQAAKGFCEQDADTDAEAARPDLDAAREAAYGLATHLLTMAVAAARKEWKQQRRDNRRAVREAGQATDPRSGEGSSSGSSYSGTESDASGGAGLMARSGAPGGRSSGDGRSRTHQPQRRRGRQQGGGGRGGIGGGSNGRGGSRSRRARDGGGGGGRGGGPPDSRRSHDGARGNGHGRHRHRRAQAGERKHSRSSSSSSSSSSKGDSSSKGGCSRTGNRDSSIKGGRNSRSTAGRGSKGRRKHRRRKKGGRAKGQTETEAGRTGHSPGHRRATGGSAGGHSSGRRHRRRRRATDGGAGGHSNGSSSVQSPSRMTTPPRSPVALQESPVPSPPLKRSRRQGGRKRDSREEGHSTQGMRPPRHTSGSRRGTTRRGRQRSSRTSGRRRRGTDGGAGSRGNGRSSALSPDPSLKSTAPRSPAQPAASQGANVGDGDGDGDRREASQAEGRGLEVQESWAKGSGPDGLGSLGCADSCLSDEPQVLRELKAVCNSAQLTGLTAALKSAGGWVPQKRTVFKMTLPVLSRGEGERYTAMRFADSASRTLTWHAIKSQWPEQRELAFSVVRHLIQASKRQAASGLNFGESSSNSSDDSSSVAEDEQRGRRRRSTAVQPCSTPKRARIKCSAALPPPS